MDPGECCQGLSMDSPLGESSLANKNPVHGLQSWKRIPFQHWTRGRGWVFIGKKISGFSPSLWPRPKIFFFLNYNSPLARPRPIAADHFLKPLSRLLDQRKVKDVQESLTKVSSFLWPKPKEMKEMVSRFAPRARESL